MFPCVMMLAQALFQLVAGADAHYPNLSPMHGSKIQLLSKILSLRFSVLRRIVPLLCFQTAKLWRSLMFQSHRCMHGYYADLDVPNPDALLRTLPNVFRTLSSTGLHALCHTRGLIDASLSRFTFVGGLLQITKQVRLQNKSSIPFLLVVCSFSSSKRCKNAPPAPKSTFPDRLLTAPDSISDICSILPTVPGWGRIKTTARCSRSCFCQNSLPRRSARCPWQTRYWRCSAVAASSLLTTSNASAGRRRWQS